MEHHPRETSLFRENSLKQRTLTYSMTQTLTRYQRYPSILVSWRPSQACEAAASLPQAHSENSPAMQQGFCSQSGFCGYGCGRVASSGTARMDLFAKRLGKHRETVPNNPDLTRTQLQFEWRLESFSRMYWRRIGEVCPGTKHLNLHCRTASGATPDDD